MVCDSEPGVSRRSRSKEKIRLGIVVPASSKYTLKLDVKPVAASVAVHAAVRAKLAGQFSVAIGPKMSRAVARLPQSVRSLAGEILDEVIDSTAATSQGLINFNGSVDVPYEDQAPFLPFLELRKFIEPVAEPNRLIVMHRSHTATFGALAAPSGAIIQAEQIVEVQRPSD